MEHVSVSNLTDVQHAIKNKFVKAFSSRIEHERNVNHAIKSLIPPNNLKSKNNDHPKQLHLPTKKNSKHVNKSQLIKSDKNKHCDPNALCIRLRKLLSSGSTDEMLHMQSVNAILEQLHELDMII